MVLTDAQFADFAPADSSFKVAFYKDTDTSVLFSSTARQIRSNKITKIYMLVHGISAVSNGSSMGMSMEGDYSLPAGISGYGLSMGSLPVCIDNVHLFRAWRGSGLQTIVMRSCSPAVGNGMGGWGDGRTMCQRIADHTGATVYASDTDQTIGTNWQGNLYRFKPNLCTGGQLVTHPYPAVTQVVDG